MQHFSFVESAPSRLDWRPDIERLRSEIEVARKAGNFEHLAIAEAECWLDLIDAELSARRSPYDPDARQLQRWRAEINAMIRFKERGGSAFSVAQTRTS